MNLETERGRFRERYGDAAMDFELEYSVRLAEATYELTDTTKAQGERVERLTRVLVATTIALLAFTVVIAWLTWELVSHEVWRGVRSAAALVTGL